MALVRRLRDKPAGPALLTGLGLTGGAAALAFAGLRVLPWPPFAAPLAQVREDLSHLRERLD